MTEPEPEATGEPSPQPDDDRAPDHDEAPAADAGKPRRSPWEIDPESYAKALARTEEEELRAGAAFPGGKPFPIPTSYVELGEVTEDAAAPAPQRAWYAVNDRPVKFQPTPDGGLDVLAMNMRTGRFERDLSYLTRCLEPHADVDQFPDEASFDAYVAELRRRILG